MNMMNALPFADNTRHFGNAADAKLLMSKVFAGAINPGI